VITGDTPDALNLAIRADFQRRHPESLLVPPPVLRPGGA
jgi:hypothetical protein